MRALRIRQVVSGDQRYSFRGSYCEPWVIVHVDERGVEDPGARCVVIYREEPDFSSFDSKYVDFIIDGGKYTGSFHTTVREHEFTISHISSL